jgi:hypothetical protein
MISFEMDGADETMNLVEGQIKHMAQLVAQEDQDTIPSEMIEWQAHDMNRKFPNLGQQDQYTYYTEIWPRSRTYVHVYQKKGPKQKSILVRGIKTAKILVKKPITTLVQRGASIRPILRDELYQKLHDRMVDLLNRVMKWR